MLTELTVSLVILTCNRKDNISAILGDLTRQECQPDEIIIVDNASSDGTFEYLRTNQKAVKTVRLENNIGCGGRNEGIKEAKGDIVITLDDDIFFNKPDGIQKIVEIFSQNKDIVVLNFKILDYKTKELISFNWFHPYKMEDYCGRDFITDYISEGAVAFRKELFNSVGYYPEEFFISHEGPDLAYRILDTGYNLHYSHEIEVLHNCSTHQRDSWRNTYFDTRNQIWLAVRNLPFIYCVLHISYRLLTTSLFSIRRRQLKWYFKAVFDGFMGMNHHKKYRKPISKDTLKRLKEIRKKKPGIAYQIRSFFKRTRSINEKFGR